MSIEIKEIRYASSEYQLEVNLRYEILRKPLGLKFTQEELKAEKDDIHLGAFRGKLLFGCLLLRKHDNTTVKMRQVAVQAHTQGTGIGRLLVEASETKAKELGYSVIELNARETAVPFYQKVGYETIGDTVGVAGLPHKIMRKKI
ncbi:GNAT family N-acetyltransferase [Bdellovibrio sp. SKB1291214]|uniref:GNAT family N-acetyltransferase n=1 Tax=Bdellovibrio sp. SKB1291214 TaxID=1732569 RepID=UPI000B518847|nr:GNAT family N-acetyltransferase [Bdellovibrio sp. SKB1291214]UYL07909.1 GNAT family N-acetyltransferase [Bdellovibrio sp. SKB1291214]